MPQLVKEEEGTSAGFLGSISNSAHSSPQAGGIRDDSSHGTPSLMDRHRKTIQTNMITIKNMMVDIAHASHHLDYLKKAETSNILPRGLKVEPRMMLVAADRATANEWAEQTRLNTLGYMRVAMRQL